MFTFYFNVQSAARLIKLGFWNFKSNTSDIESSLILVLGHYEKMNPDEYDFRRHIPREPSNEALDLIRGLEDRSLNLLKRNIKAKESREIFAEDELVRKECYDEMRCEMPGQPRSTFLMVFSPDGSKVASTHGNHNIYVTDIKSGKNIKTLTGHPRTPWCIAFHPTSNQIVASGCLGGEVRIWDLSVIFSTQKLDLMYLFS